MLLEDLLEKQTIKDVKHLADLNLKLGLTSGLLIGSAAKGLFDPLSSDIDLLFLSPNNLDLSKVISTIKKNNFNLVRHNELYILEKSNPSIHICYKNSKSFIDNINNILNGDCLETINRSWVVGGEIKDVLLLDLTRAIILFNSSLELNSLIDNIKINRRFFELVSAFVEHEILEKVDLCLSASKSNDYLSMYVGFGEVLVSLSRLYCAKHKIFNPGFKHLINDDSFVKEYNLNFLAYGELNQHSIRSYLECLAKNRNIGS
jgi:predicted nucleotidyltransferase